MKLAFCTLLLVCGWGGAVCAQAPRTARHAAAPETLTFQEILAPDPTVLRPSDKLQRLNGQRVRIRGFMAEFEQPTKGHFYLTPRRVRGDESGNGTADLPVESIRVTSAKQHERQWEHIPAILEIVGVISVGSDGTADDAGNYAAIRLAAESIYVIQPARRGGKQRRKHPSTSFRRN
jgi:hypothetical protein